MYRMVVVEDNPWERTGIQRLVEWERLGIEIVGAFENGTQALRHVDGLDPRIVLSDVVMPKMNGIEMARELRKTRPDIKVVFLTAHSDFEFAKSALDLDICGYVLKPIVKEELIEAVEKVVASIKTETSSKLERRKMLEQIRGSLPFVQEQFLRELLFDNLHTAEEIRDRMSFLHLDLFDDMFVTVLVIQIHRRSHTLRLSTEDKYAVLYTIRKAVDAENVDGTKIVPVQISERKMAVVYCCPPDTNVDHGERVLDFAVGIHEMIGGRFGLFSVFGISETSRDISTLSGLYEQATACVDNVFLGNGTPIHFYAEIEENQHGKLVEHINMKVLYSQVKDVMFDGSSRGIRKVIDRHLGAGVSPAPEGYVRTVVLSILNAAQIALLEEGKGPDRLLCNELIMGTELTSLGSMNRIKEWLYETLLTACREVTPAYLGRNETISNRIREIVESRYHEDISARSIATEVCLSVKQANRIFRDQTGLTIFDYVIQYRVRMAKTLLENPTSRISEVAERVGYSNKSYFSLLFKKHTGMTPMEYKMSPRGVT